ncbi:MAG TPA: TspO/MBR family protein [Marmoricola sp.]|nr:TspO/MBR family protein [Marmoricola sp.]
MERPAPTVSALALGVGGPLLAAALGGLAARDADVVYARLDKPAWAPPPGIFGPVWSVLYAMIGVSGWRVARRRQGALAVGLHLGQLALNATWTPLFFGRRRKGAALAVVSALDVVVAGEIAVLRRRDPTAAALLAPYLAWSLFATALNAAVQDPSAAV